MANYNEHGDEILTDETEYPGYEWEQELKRREEEEEERLYAEFWTPNPRPFERILECLEYYFSRITNFIKRK